MGFHWTVLGKIWWQKQLLDAVFYATRVMSVLRLLFLRLSFTCVTIFCMLWERFDVSLLLLRIIEFIP